MRQQRRPYRSAPWLLFAAAALPSTALAAQDAPPADPPGSNVVVPPADLPEPVIAAPPVATEPVPSEASPEPTPVPTAATTNREAGAREARASGPTVRSTVARAPSPARSQPAARPAERAGGAPAASDPASAAAVAPAAAVPVAAAPLPVPDPAPEDRGSIWAWMVGGALLLLLATFALFQMWRHRRRAGEEDAYGEAEPVGGERAPDAPMVAAPAMAAASAVAAAGADERAEAERSAGLRGDADQVPSSELRAGAGEDAIALPGAVALADADPGDVEMLAAASGAPEGRAWLEFLMRPLRAGTSKDAAVVEFELTIGNTGSEPARDVRISTFMFAGDSDGGSEMERMLIEPPAGAAVAAAEIDAGEATRLETTVSLPREALAGSSALPVVVADARYRLADGSEGRTRAVFEVGVPAGGDALDPFPIDGDSGLVEGVEARLHGEPQRA